MTSAQLARRDIKDERVLEAMRRVPRHAFMPKEMHHLAYQDYPVSIGFDQTISQPYIVAFMTQALRPGKQARVLEIGTGSGYQAAVLAELVKEVYTIEIIPGLGRRARKACTDLGYENIRYRIGDGYKGWSEAAPFDAIIVTAAPGHIPQPLIDQLAVGGRMIIPVGKNHQELVLLERKPDGVVRRHVMAVRFVPMTGEAEKH
jgi:protein-L-isoaspartate(D-aspartate) O-methyltransferase